MPSLVDVDLRGVAGSRAGMIEAAAWLFLVFSAELALALVAVAMRPSDSDTALVWPAAAVSVAAVALVSRRLVAPIAAAVGAAVLAANLLGGHPVLASAGFAVANTGAALLAGALLTSGFTRRPTLDGLRDLTRLVAAVALGSLFLGLTAGAVVASLLDGPGWHTVVTAASSHAAAGLLLLPALLLRRSVGGAVRVPEAAAHVALLAGVLAVLFLPGQVLPLTALTFPVLALAAARLAPRLMALELVVIGICATTATMLDSGLFAAAQKSLGVAASTSVWMTQVYLAACLLTALPLTVAMEQRRRVLERAVASERLFRQGFDESMLGMLLLRLAGDRLVVERVNAGARQLLLGDGTATEQIVLADVLTPDDAEKLRAACQQLGHGSSGWQSELRIVRGSTSAWVDVAVSRIDEAAATDESAQPGARFTVQMVDTTARHEVEARLTQLALHDGLTGLPNRTLLNDRLCQLLRVAARDGALVGLLLVDLDEFKLVNDTYGHVVGDAMLVQVGQRLVQAVRPGDTVARFGGDEFVVLCPALTDVETASVLAERLATALEAPIEFESRSYDTSASVGIAVGDGNSTADTLLRDADAAMYASKATGRRRATLFADEQRWRAVRTVQLEQALQQAVRNNELLLHVQPIVDLQTGLIVAGETLVRWQHPERGLLLPGEWLDVAEQSALIHELGHWVLREACRLGAQWAQTVGDAAPAVHVNVSARQFEHGDLCEVIGGLLDEFGLPGHRLVLELTETHLDRINHSLGTDVAELTRRGVVLAADDFGTGYSPLTRVTDLPVEMLKIDRQFVMGLGHDPRASAVVHAIVGIGRALGLQVVAEGVESAAQAQTLKELGCTSGQGYLWSPPRPSESFLTQLRSQHRRAPASRVLQMARQALGEG